MVSILIPNFNKIKYVEKTFESIVRQSFRNWECIVVDDHSDDGSYEVIEKFAIKDKRIKLFRRPSDIPKGGNHCRNFAFELSSGEYIQWFDSDDIMLPDFLVDKVKFLSKNKEYAYVASKARIEFQKNYIGKKLFKQTIESQDDVISDYLKFRILFLPGGPLFRREVFEKVGLFNPGLKKHQEWELFFRVVLSFPNWGVINKEGFVYFINNDSITARMSQKQRLINAEIKAIKTALDYSKNQFITLAPEKIRKLFLLRYLKFSLIHKQFSDAWWFFSQYIKQTLGYKAPMQEYSME